MTKRSNSFHHIVQWEEAGQLIICCPPCPPNPDCQSTTGTRRKLVKEKGIDSPLKCDPGKTKWNDSSHRTEKNSRKKSRESRGADNPEATSTRSFSCVHRGQRPQTGSRPAAPTEPGRLVPPDSASGFFCCLFVRDSIPLDSKNVKHEAQKQNVFSRPQEGGERRSSRLQRGKKL